jgi:hypothetical protein
MPYKPAELAAILRPFLLGDMAQVAASAAAQADWDARYLRRYRIRLYDPTGPTVTDFEPTSAGLADAIAAATSGDTIWLPPGTYGGDHTIPAGVTVAGLSRKDVVLTGQVTTGDGTVLAHLSVNRTASQSADLIAVQGPPTGIAYVYDCILSAKNSTGDGYAVYTGVGEIELYYCSFSAQSAGIDATPFGGREMSALEQTDINWKTLSLWNGVGNDSPPANWTAGGFDDSGWGYAVDTGHQDNSDPADPDDCDAIWPTMSPESRTVEALFRKTFNLASVPTAVMLYVNADDNYKVYINEILVAEDTWNVTSVSDSPEEVDITSYLNSGDNIIAIHGQNYDNLLRLAYVMARIDGLVSAPSIHVYACHFNKGLDIPTPLKGDRSAWNVSGFGGCHAKDIEDGSPLYHWTWAQIWARILATDGSGSTLDADLLDGQHGAYYLDLGNATQHLALAKLADYARGCIVRGGAADWEAYSASGNHQVLIGNGTDLESRVLANSDLPDPFAFAGAPTTETISGGAITATKSTHIIAAETGTEDDLDTINGLTDRQLLLIKADTGDTITVKHATGNIHFDSGADFELSGDSWLLLFYDGTNVVALGAGDGGNGASTFTGLTDTPAVYTDEGGKLIAVNSGEDALEFVESPSGTHVLLYSQTVDETVANTTDETDLMFAGRGSKTIPADTLEQGSTLRLTLMGHLSDSGAPTLNIKVSLGGTEVCSTGAQALNNTVTEVDWHLTVLIACRSTGATGTVVASGLFEHDNDAQFGLVKTSATTIDITAALEVMVTATWGTADAGNTITCQEATIELLKADDLAPVAPTGLEATEL